MEIQSVDLVSLARMALILLHVLAVAAAGASIAFGDYAIFARRQIDAALLYRSGQAVTAALIVLWMTGLAVIWMDTRFQLAALAANPKLLAKLTVATLLSLNGVALHRIGFKRLCGGQAVASRAATLPTVMGAISVVTWLNAAFLGLASPVAPLLGYAGFMGLYFGTLAIGIAVALVVMRPRLARRVALTQQPMELVIAPIDMIDGSNEAIPAKAVSGPSRWLSAA